MTTASLNGVAAAESAPRRERMRPLLIGLIAFLTVVDLFAAQAVLPALARVYDVGPAAMGSAVNASTLGMAVAGLAVATLSRSIDRRRGIVFSLVALGVPTALLAVAPDLTTFTLLRILQGVFMATAFTLTLAYLGEHCSPSVAGSAFAAYVAGNVASNLFGRLLAAIVADHLGLAPTFLVLASLNLAGALLVYLGLTHSASMSPMPLQVQSALSILRRHFGTPPLRAAFAAGFCILFAFIGTFTYVNFVLTRPPIGLDQAGLGLVYFVFILAILTTPWAGQVVRWSSPKAGALIGFGTAAAGLPLLLVPMLAPMLAGLALIGVGTFFAQAVATGFVAQAADGDRGAASGLYLASYFSGGLVGSVALGRLFDGFGWIACVSGIGASLLIGALVSSRLVLASEPRR